MAQKITAKNLSYDSSLPPFLAALRAQAAGHTQSPTPQRRGAPKKRSASEEAEDAPLVVDEHGNVVDLDARAQEDEAESGEQAQDPSRKHAPPKTQQQDGAGKSAAETNSAISVGAGKRRRVGKVVGGEAEGPEDGEEKLKASKQHDKRDGGVREDESVKTTKTATTKPDSKVNKKKPKKIKLSFDEADG